MSTAWVRSASASSSSLLARPAAGLAVAARGGDLGPVLWAALAAPVTRELLDLRIGDEHALEADRARRVDRLVEHVAAAEQVLGAGRVEDRARVDLEVMAKAMRRGEVRLDQAGDDVDRRPLRGDDEVDAGRAGELGEAADLASTSKGADHHQVGQLVDDDDQVRHPRLPGRSACCSRRCCARRGGELAVAALHLLTVHFSALTAFSISTMTSESRCGMPLYAPARRAWGRS